MDDTPAKLEHKAQVLFSDPNLVHHDTENSSDFTHMPRNATIGKTGYTLPAEMFGGSDFWMEIIKILTYA